MLGGTTWPAPSSHRARFGVIVCLAVAGLAILFWSMLDVTVDDNPDTDPASSLGGAAASGTDSPSSESEAFADPLPPDALWRPVELSTVDPKSIPPYKEVVKHRALVRLMDPQRKLTVGDRVSVFIPQLGEVFRPVVERIETGPGSTRSVVGYGVGSDGQRNRFVFTQGPHSAFAHIRTSQGTYELVAKRELGWLMPTAGMDQHVDYSKPDYYIVRPGGPDRPTNARR